MNRFKVSRKNNMVSLYTKSTKGQRLDPWAVNQLCRGELQGLLPLRVSGSEKSFELAYNITGYQTLDQFLRGALLDKPLFVKLLDNVFRTIAGLPGQFRAQNLLLGFSRVMLNPSTKNVYFAYVPIIGYDNGTNLREFYLALAKAARFLAGEDTSFIGEFVKILNDGINFSVVAVEEFIQRQHNVPSAEEPQLCRKCNYMLKSTAKFCPHCGMARDTDTSGGDGRNYNPLKPYFNDDSDKKDPSPAPNPSPEKVDTARLGPGTTVEPSDDLGPHFPTLIRISTGEKVSVNKPVFRLGKEKQSVDFFISQNSAVSRSHADIITREGRYFLIDRNSTNKTYINGQVIRIEQEKEIFPGDEITLANEKLTFYT